MKIFQKTQKATAFTLVEILVVIAIIGILSFIGSNFSMNKQNDAEKRDRFVTSISNLINKTKTDTLLWRWVFYNGATINPESTRILLSTGSIKTTYWDSTPQQIGTGEILQAPFYGDSGYVIANIFASGSTGTGLIDMVIFRWSEISFSGAYADSGAVLSIIAGYSKNYKTLLFDKRTGKIEIQ